MRVGKSPSAVLLATWYPYVGIGRKVWGESYSNLRAAILLGKPETTATISHGRSDAREVRVAPPFTSPLCCLSRLGG